MRSAIRCSRNARIWVVIEPQVVTVSTVLRRPAPATRTHTLASLFEISSPAQRACTTSTALVSFPPSQLGGPAWGEQEIQKSDPRARWHQSTVPAEALRHHADLQAHRHH